MRFASTVATLFAAAGAGAAPLEARAVIDHDAVVGFPTTVPAGALGDAYRKFQPWLKVETGCVPFPAVDAEGNTSGGLNPSGGHSSGCSKSTGQVYVRGTKVGSRYGLMYSWYMPKDSPSPELGHRHEWEGVVAWVEGLEAGSPRLVGVSTSGHGGWTTATSNLQVDGTRPKIRYYSTWPLNHQVGTTDVRGGEQPLVAWESLPAAARAALQNTDFGAANVPFRDPNFMNNLAAAAF